MDTLTSLINQLITSGGIGFINLFLLIRLDYINFSKENKEDKYLYLLFFSIVNYSIYLLIVEVSKYFSLPIAFHIPIAILFVLILSIIFTFILWIPLIKILFKKVNDYRGKDKRSSYDSRSIKKIAFSFKENKAIFIFDFDNKLIFSGISGWFSDIDEADFEFILYPFNESTELDNYDTLIKYVSTENIDADVYINIDKKIKVIIIN